MAIVMQMVWRGVSPAQYEAARQVVDWEGKPPTGGLFHVAAFDNDGLRVTDVWNSAEELDAFVQQRLLPGVKEVGITSEPRVEVLSAHAIFAPGFAGTHS